MQFQDIPGPEIFLGEGAHGKVKKQRGMDGAIVACKIIKFENGRRGRTKEDAEKECSLLKSIKHVNVVDYISMHFLTGEARIYMEYCDSNTLHDKINEYINDGHTCPDEAVAWTVVADISAGLSYCHDYLKEVVLHRDIKPANIFLSNDARRGRTLYKLGDFGVGTILHEGRFPNPGTYTGTDRYRAPEISNTNPEPLSWDKKCDIFSFGCTVYEFCMLTPRYKWHVKTNETVPSPKPLPDSYSQALRDCISRCCEFDPERRPHAFEIHYNARCYQHRGVEGVLASVSRTAISTLGTDSIRQSKGINRTTRDFGIGTSGGIVSDSGVLAAPAGEEVAASDASEIVPGGSNSQLQSGLNQAGSPHRPLSPDFNKKATISKFKPGVQALTEEQPESPRKILERNGFKVRSKFSLMFNNDEPQALNWAAENGNLDVVRFLLQRGVKPNPKTKSDIEKTALILAAENNHADVVLELLKNGALVTARSKCGLNALAFAARNGHLAIIKLLLERGAAINDTSSSCTALIEAAGGGHASVIQELISRGAKTSAANSQAINRAAATGTGEAIAALVLAGFNVETMDPEEDGMRPLHFAAMHNNVSTAEALIQHEAEIDSLTRLGVSPLFIATTYRSKKVYDILMAAGASKELVWFSAVKGGINPDVMRAMVKEGVRITCQDSRGIDALQHFIRERTISTTGSLLLELGLQLGGPDNYGYQALCEAAAASYELGVRFLVDNGVQVDVNTREGRKLLGTDYRRNTEIVSYLRQKTKEQADEREQAAQNERAKET